MDSKTKAQISKIYCENFNKLKAAANGLLNNSDDSEDAVHMAFERIIYTKHKYRYYDNFTYSAIEDICRGCAQEILIKRNSAIYTGSSRVTVKDPLEVIVHQEDAERIIESIASLKHIYKCVMEPYVADNMPVREIVRELGLKRDTVAKRIQRGKHHLAALLKRKGYDVGFYLD